MENLRPDGEKEFLAEPEKARLLERASELDMAHASGAEVRELRAAAMEAGISTAAFDTALAEMRDRDKVPVDDAGNRRASRWAMGVVATAAIIVIVALTRTPKNSGTLAGAPMIDQTISLRCVQANEAADIARPILNSPGNTIVLSPKDAPHVLRIHATAEQIREVQGTLDAFEARSAGACSTRN